MPRGKSGRAVTCRPTPSHAVWSHMEFGSKERGYLRADFEDAWQRYLSPIAERDKRDKRDEIVTMDGQGGRTGSAPSTQENVSEVLRDGV
jgi:hypothetical protein